MPALKEVGNRSMGLAFLSISMTEVTSPSQLEVLEVITKNELLTALPRGTATQRSSWARQGPEETFQLSEAEEPLDNLVIVSDFQLMRLTLTQIKRI